MTNSIYPPHGSTPKAPTVPASLPRQLLFCLVKVISAFSGSIGFVAALKFGMGAQALVVVQKEFVDASPLTLGATFGELIDGPYALIILFGWLSWKLWVAADSIRVPMLTKDNSPTISTVRKFVDGILAATVFIFRALAALHIFHASL